MCTLLVAGDVYFDVQSIGDSYGKFVGAMGSQRVHGKVLVRAGNCSTLDNPSGINLTCDYA